MDKKSWCWKVLKVEIIFGVDVEVKEENTTVIDVWNFHLESVLLGYFYNFKSNLLLSLKKYK